MKGWVAGGRILGHACTTPCAARTGRVGQGCASGGLKGRQGPRQPLQTQTPALPPADARVGHLMPRSVPARHGCSQGDEGAAAPRCPLPEAKQEAAVVLLRLLSLGCTTPPPPASDRPTGGITAPCRLEGRDEAWKHGGRQQQLQHQPSEARTARTPMTNNGCSVMMRNRRPDLEIIDDAIFSWYFLGRAGAAACFSVAPPPNRGHARSIEAGAPPSWPPKGTHPQLEAAAPNAS